MRFLDWLTTVRTRGIFRSAKGAPLRTRVLPARNFWRRLHRDEHGAVTLETILIIGAIALPILIFVLKFGWPRIRDYFNSGLDELEIETDRTAHGG